MWECIQALPFPRNSDRVLAALIAPHAPRRFCRKHQKKAVADHVRSNHIERQRKGQKKEEEKERKKKAADTRDSIGY